MVTLAEIMEKIINTEKYKYWLAQHEHYKKRKSEIFKKYHADLEENEKNKPLKWEEVLKQPILNQAWLDQIEKRAEEEYALLQEKAASKTNKTNKKFVGKLTKSEEEWFAKHNGKKAQNEPLTLVNSKGEPCDQNGVALPKQPNQFWDGV